MEWITKKQQLKNAISDENWKKALGIAKGFIIEFNTEQQRILQIAHESFDDNSRKNFYKLMGVDVEKNQEQAIAILKKYK